MVIVPVAGWESVTVKTNGVVPEFPSGSATLLMVAMGVTSSLTIVPMPIALPMVALVIFGLPGVLIAGPIVTKNVSSGSVLVSPMTGTRIVCEVVPGRKVSVPLVAV